MNVWVAVEHNSGGAHCVGVAETLAAAEAAFVDKRSMMIVSANDQTVIWKRPDNNLTVTLMSKTVVAEVGVPS